MKRVSLVLVCLALLVFGGHRVADANKTLAADLTGAAEIGGGDPDGTGSALINFSPASNEICFDIRVSNLATPTAAHIHHAAAGINGPVVVPLSAPVNGVATGCVTADPALIKDIMQHPEDYYVNVHTVEYPGGAIRGQLSR